MSVGESFCPSCVSPDFDTRDRNCLRCCGTGRILQWADSKTLVEGRTVRMVVPQPQGDASVDARIRLTIAGVLEHEAQHLVGITHADMHERVYRCRQDTSAWLGDLPLEEALPPPALSREDKLAAAALAKGAHLAKKVAEYERIVARATRLRAKWAKKLAAWERRQTPERLAAARRSP